MIPQRNICLSLSTHPGLLLEGDFIAVGNVYFSKKVLIFSYFSIKTYLVCTYYRGLGEVPVRTHKIYFC